MGDVITPDYDGYLQPEGWIPRRAISRPTLGLALSGGGMRGLAHIGVLQALEENNIRVDNIAGASMGSIVGALYSSGYSVAEMKNIMLNADWGDLFIDQPSRRTLFLNRKRTHGRHLLQIRFHGWSPYIPTAITMGQKLGQFLDDLTMNAVYKPEPDFDHLKYHFRAPATDLITGKLIRFDRGDLTEVMRASMAFPLVFSPAYVDGRYLIDGGAVENIPVATAKSMGSDKVIAVDTVSPLLPKVSQPWEIANQVTTIMIQEGMDKSKQDADLVISPTPDSISSFDFTYTDSIPDMGYIAAKSYIDTIRAMLTDTTSPEGKIYYPEAIKFDLPADSKINTADELILPKGQPVSEKAIRQYLTVLYNNYEFDDIRAEMIQDTLVVTASAPPWFWHISVKGNRVLPDSLIKSVIKSSPGKPVSYRQGVADRENILRLYRKNGYTLASIKKTEISGGSLVITIDEGKIAEMSVEGGRPSAINDLGQKKGEVFNWFSAQKGVNRLYGTDLFDMVRVVPEKAQNGYNIKLKLERRSFPVIRMGARFDMERGTSGFAEFIMEDMFGSGTAVTMFVSPGEKETRANGILSADRILGSYLNFNAGAYYTREEYSIFDDEHKRMPGYSYERSWTAFSLGQHLFRWGMITAALKLERAMSDFPGDLAEQGLATLVFESLIDTYDRYPFPRSGQNIRITFQTCGDIIPEDLNYSRISGDIQRWTILKRRWSLLTRLRGGYAEPTVPSFEKFSIGGLQDFMGLHERENLGNQLIGGSVGFRYDLLSRFLAEAFITARYDFAQIVDGTDVLEFEKGFFRQGGGLIFSLNTLIGPVELGWGVAARYKDIPGNNIVYFSLGHAF